MDKKKAIAAGHICLDITPAFKSKEEKSIKDLFRPGQLIAMDAAKVSLGGSVSNTGIGMKRLGADVELMGMVGNDAFGQMVLNELEKYDISPDSMIVRDGVGTSYSVILAPAGIDRIFLHCSGANDTFTLDDIDLEKVKEANLFHFGYPSLMRMMYIDGGKELVRLLKAVHELGVAVSVDMAMFEESTEAGAQDWNEVLKSVIPYIDFFVPSIEELCIMLDRDRYHEWNERAQGADVTNFLDIEKDVRPLADKLLVCSAMICLIEKGSLAAWIVIVIIAREFIISGFRLVASDNGIVIAASYWGKFKTVFQMAMVIVLIMDLGGAFDVIGQALIWISLALTIISLIDYVAKNIQVLTNGGM